MRQKNQAVFMIGWEYPPHNSGGLGVASEGITKSLASTGAQIYFTLPYTLGAGVSHMQVLPCIDKSWEKTNLPPFMAYASCVKESKNKPLDAFTLHTLPTSQMEQKVEQYSDLVVKAGQKIRQKYDVIHAHDWMSFPAAIRLKKLTHKPLIAHIHSTEYDRIPSGNGSPYIIQAEKDGMLAADLVIAVSAFTKHILVKKYQIDPAKIKVVHNGLSATDLKIAKLQPESKINSSPLIAPKRPIIVFMGRLTAQKGVNYILEVAKKVTEKLPRVLFVIAGDGDMYHELLLSTSAQSLTASVLFSGFLRNVQREKLLDRADLFLMPSISEPFGLVALEAAAKNTPVILSKTAGVNEVMPSAKAIDFWDVNQMAVAIIELLDDKKKYQAQVAGQNKEVYKATWNNAATKISNIYKQLFNR